MRTARLLYCLTLVSLVPSILYGANATDVLSRAEEADRHVSYRGVKTATVSFRGGAATAVLKVIHLCPDKTRTQYFSPAVMAGIILVQDGPDIWKYIPREDVWEHFTFAPPPPISLIRRDALRNYDVKLVGTEQVAGRTAYVIHAMPRNLGEAAHRMWVDREFYLMIGTQVEDDSGTVVRSSRYVSLQLNPEDISPSMFEVHGKIRPRASHSTCIRIRMLKPSYLPAGYRLIGSSRLCMRGYDCAHLQFGNGANMISLFERKANHEAPCQPVASKVTNVLVWARGGMQFTIMGDLSRAELQKIADSVR